MSRLFRLLSRLLPVRRVPAGHPILPHLPARIILIQPCCIGDVVMATALLVALRRAYPRAQITWAVGHWSRPALDGHPLLDSLLETGDAALPVYHPGDFWRFVRNLRAGHYDLAVVPVRSPLMSLAVLLSGIPDRAGLDSAGRGFGYNLRAAIQPDERRHEADIYLDLARRLHLDTDDCYTTIPVQASAIARVQQHLTALAIQPPFIVIHPGGGSNPGMVMDSKRYPPENFAALADALHHEFHTTTILIGGPKDGVILDAVQAQMTTPVVALVGLLSFAEIGALAAQAQVYIGNDTGLTHLAAASGAKTVMVMGPSDPTRYAPFAPNALALWKPVKLNARGVSAGTPQNWDWSRDGIPVTEALTQISAWLRNRG